MTLPVPGLSVIVLVLDPVNNDVLSLLVNISAVTTTPFSSYVKSQCNLRKDALDESTGRLEEIFVQSASGADVIVHCSRGRER